MVNEWAVATERRERGVLSPAAAERTGRDGGHRFLLVDAALSPPRPPVFAAVTLPRLGPEGSVLARGRCAHGGAARVRARHSIILDKDLCKPYPMKAQKSPLA
jgi:hypothetical protein